MKIASKFFCYVGLSLIVATAIIVIVELPTNGVNTQELWSRCVKVARVSAYHSVAIACCLALSKILDRD